MARRGIFKNLQQAVLKNGKIREDLVEDFKIFIISEGKSEERRTRNFCLPALFQRCIYVVLGASIFSLAAQNCLGSVSILPVVPVAGHASRHPKSKSKGAFSLPVAYVVYHYSLPTQDIQGRCFNFACRSCSRSDLFTCKGLQNQQVHFFWPVV